MYVKAIHEKHLSLVLGGTALLYGPPCVPVKLLHPPYLPRHAEVEEGGGGKKNLAHSTFQFQISLCKNFPIFFPFQT